MQFIDAHAHLTSKSYKNTLDDVLQRSCQAGVTRWVTIGTDIADSVRCVELCNKYEDIYCAVGVHPHDAKDVTDESIEQLRQMIQASHKVKAIGEIGLDYYYEHRDKSTQKQVFRQQLELAGETGLPVVIHCREAFDDCMAVLREFGRDDVPILFHCFGGDVEQAKTVFDQGYYISFTGILTFSNARQTQEVAGYAPLERVLLETDCPYLSPEPKRGVRPNEPAFMVHTANKLAQLRDMPPEDIAKITTGNTMLFFGIE